MKSNTVTIKSGKEQLVPISDLTLGQLFVWKSTAFPGTLLVGIRTVNMHGDAMGVLFYEGTYLTQEVEVTPLEAGTAVTVVAG